MPARIPIRAPASEEGIRHDLTAACWIEPRPQFAGSVGLLRRVGGPGGIEPRPELVERKDQFLERLPQASQESRLFAEGESWRTQEAKQQEEGDNT